MLTAEELHRLADKFESLRTAVAPRHEEGETIESIDATGVTPIKAVGDLAQVSTGATGAETDTIGLMEWSVKFKRTAVTSTTTDGNGWASKLASTAEWTATAKYAYIDGDTSQAAIRAAITTLQTTSQKYNFFNQPATGRDSWSGNAIMTGIDFTTGTGKIFGMDITLEGDGPLTLIPQLAPTAGTGNQPALIAED
jgi:hypothetical protein